MSYFFAVAIVPKCKDSVAYGIRYRILPNLMKKVKGIYKWRVGGFWDGVLAGGEPTFKASNKNIQYHRTEGELKGNMLPVFKIDENVPLPFAMITPDGGIKYKTDYADDIGWRVAVSQIYRKYASHMAVGLDCRRMNFVKSA